MSDEFYCFSCRKWKSNACKSEHKYSKSWLCTLCLEKRRKSRKLDGRLSKLTPEQLDKARYNHRKKSEDSRRRRRADIDAEALSRKLRGD